MKENEDLISRSTLLDSFRKCYSGHMGMENSDNMMMFKSICRIINDQEAIGTIEEFKALKEKNEPKEVAYQLDTWGHKHEKCPTCGSFHVFGKHCTECGQSIYED